MRFYLKLFIARLEGGGEPRETTAKGERGEAKRREERRREEKRREEEEREEKRREEKKDNK